MDDLDKMLNVRGLADFLLHIMRKETFKAVAEDNAQLLYNLTLHIWKKHDDDIQSQLELLNRVYNSTLGILLLIWIQMISIYNSLELQDYYKDLFDQCFSLKGKERRLAIGVLAGHFNFFYLRDKEWCRQRLIPLLTGDNKADYSAAWTGIVHFSRQLNTDVADVLAPIYLDAVEHLDWLDKKTRQSFIDIYAVLVCRVIEHPEINYIPKLYQVASIDERKYFVEQINWLLKRMNDEEKSLLWDSWLRKFLKRAQRNIPAEPTEEEKQVFLLWLLELEPVFEEAVHIICNGLLPRKNPSRFFYYLNQKKYAEKNKKGTYSLLIALLNSDMQLVYVPEHLMKTINSFNKLTKTEHTKLEEALMKNGITIEDPH